MIVTHLFEARHWFSKAHQWTTGGNTWWLGCGYEPDFTLNVSLFLCPVHCEYHMEIQIACFWIRGGYSK